VGALTAVVTRPECTCRRPGGRTAARPRRASVHDRGWPTPPSASLTAHHR